MIGIAVGCQYRFGRFRKFIIFELDGSVVVRRFFKLDLRVKGSFEVFLQALSVRFGNVARQDKGVARGRDIVIRRVAFSLHDVVILEEIELFGIFCVGLDHILAL